MSHWNFSVTLVNSKAALYRLYLGEEKQTRVKLQKIKATADVPCRNVIRQILYTWHLESLLRSPNTSWCLKSMLLLHKNICTIL